MPSTLKSLVQSRHPLISIETRDEEHAIELVREIAKELSRRIDVVFAGWALLPVLLRPVNRDGQSAESGPSSERGIRCDLFGF